MHYYQFNIGDYKSHTDHLTNLEDLAYRRLLDWLYLHEKPLPLDQKKTARLIRMGENIQEIENVLDEYFKKTSNGWEHLRVSEEVSLFKSKQDIARANGKKGGRPKIAKKTKPVNEKTKGVNLVNQEKSGLKANQEPITINQEPLTNNQLDQKHCQPNGLTETKKTIEQTIFDYWVVVMDKDTTRTKFTPKRKKAIKARLKEGYSKEIIFSAITGCKNDPFSQGQNNNQTVYDDLELICRSGEHLERYANKANQSQLPVMSKTSQTNYNALKNIDLDKI